MFECIPGSVFKRRVQKRCVSRLVFLVLSFIMQPSNNTNLRVTGLSPRVIEMIQNVKVASTHSAYDGKSDAFERWCTDTIVLYSFLLYKVLAKV